MGNGLRLSAAGCRCHSRAVQRDAFPSPMQRSELQSRQERDTLGRQRVANRPPALPAVVAALLLFALIVPIAAAKLDAFWVSEPTFSLETEQPVCVASGLCFRLVGDSLERNGSVHRVALRISGVVNVYQALFQC
jgi:hypothetical protein